MAVHRLAALAQPVDIPDRDQVVEPVERRVLQRLPLRALRDLAVAAEHPHTEREPREALAGKRHPDSVRQALPERSRGNVDPGDSRGRVPLERAVEAPVTQELVIGDRPRGAKHRVEERGSVALGEDKPIVVGIPGLVEVIPEVFREQDRHQVGRRHSGGRVPRAGLCRRANGIDAQLLSQLTPEARHCRPSTARRMRLPARSPIDTEFTRWRLLGGCFGSADSCRWRDPTRDAYGLP